MTILFNPSKHLPVPKSQSSPKLYSKQFLISHTGKKDDWHILPHYTEQFGYTKSLIPTTMLITGVAILESVGIAKALAAKNGYELNSNQELFGLGVANIVGSFFSVYPTTGSFSRSAVNHESGAKTGLSGVVMGIIMGCALQFLTPLFELIPQCALAAIVISAVIGLIAIANPNREVLLTLTRSGVVDLIGKEWYFVRIHDAVQVCLQHVQRLTGSPSPRTQSSLLENRGSPFQRLMRYRPEENSLSQLESGNKESITSNDGVLEPLLSKKP